LSEKTEKPTPKRLRDAREKGQIAKSKEVATCASIVGLFVYFWFFFENFLLGRFKYLVGSTSPYFNAHFERALVTCLKIVFQEFAIISLPFVFVAMVLAVLAYLVHIGWLISFESIKPDLSKIDPMQGIKRIFSMSNLFELVKSIIKILLLGAIIYLVMKDNFANLLYIYRGNIQTAQDLLSKILKQLTVYISALFIVVAIIDYFLQKHLHIKKLMMSKDDIKREYKDREGDPHVKGQRRQIQMEMAADDMAAKIKEATVVLTESTRKAVVLYFEMGKTPLPVVTVKGKNNITKRIVDIAKKYDVPVIEDADLTRKLYEECEQDNYITRELIEPVAVILRKVLGLGGGDSD